MYNHKFIPILNNDTNKNIGLKRIKKNPFIINLSYRLWSKLVAKRIKTVKETWHHSLSFFFMVFFFIFFSLSLLPSLTFFSLSVFFLDSRKRVFSSLIYVYSFVMNKFIFLLFSLSQINQFQQNKVKITHQIRNNWKSQ